MKLKSFIPFVSILFLLSCSTSVEPKASKEVLITIWNECYCRITFYKEGGSSFRDTYDCEHVKTLPVYLEEGTCRVVADNGYGKVVEIELVKKYYSQELGIVF
jgi:hypothetical protein